MFIIWNLVDLKLIRSLIFLPECQVFGKIEDSCFKEDRIEVFLLQALKCQPLEVIKMLTFVKCKPFAPPENQAGFTRAFFSWVFSSSDTPTD